jgi:methylmalonyl-CoA mutase N-terminal domain/subunit
MREAGCTAAQEIAFTLADGIAYVEAALAAGLDIDDFAGRLSFFFACHNNFLEEVAKFRAARRLWAKIMKERFDAKNARSQALRFHTQTGGATLTAQQPENNIVRTAIQALAAVLGGTQSLHTNSMDEALALPSEKAVQIALRTQQVIAYESGVGDVVDPLGGSYYLEDLTNRLEAEAADYIKTIDGFGGSLAAIERGFQQKEIQEAAYRYQLQVESKDHIIVGVNEFTVQGEAAPDLLHVDPSLGQRQAERLRILRAGRDNRAVEAALARLQRAAEGTENLLPIMVDCVESRVTLGEISHRLRRVWGEQRETVVI